MAFKKIGTQQGSVQENYLKELKGTLEGLEIVALGRNPQLIQELKIGRIDAVLIAEIQAKEFVKANPELNYNTIDSKQQGTVIALKKGSRLTEEFNNALDKLEKDGVLEKLKTKWFK